MRKIKRSRNVLKKGVYRINYGDDGGFWLEGRRRHLLLADEALNGQAPQKRGGKWTRGFKYFENSLCLGGAFTEGSRPSRLIGALTLPHTALPSTPQRKHVCMFACIHMLTIWLAVLRNTLYYAKGALVASHSTRAALKAAKHRSALRRHNRLQRNGLGVLHKLPQIVRRDAANEVPEAVEHAIRVVIIVKA